MACLVGLPPAPLVRAVFCHRRHGPDAHQLCGRR